MRREIASFTCHPLPYLCVAIIIIIITIYSYIYIYIYNIIYIIIYYIYVYMVLLCCPLHIKSNTKVGLMLETRRECRLLAFSAHRGCARLPKTETGTLLYKHTIRTCTLQCSMC